jgi:hypothetical protein
MGKDMILTSRYRRHILTAIMVVTSVFLGGGVSSWASQPAPPANSAPVQSSGSESQTTVAPPATHAPSLEETYAAREAAAKDLEPFKGGDLVIVGSGGLVLVLLIILILVLV